MGLFENLKSETVRQMNLRDPVLVRPEDSVREVVKSLRDASLGCAIVVDTDNRPVGMFTESMLTQLVVSNPQALDDAIQTHAADRWAQLTLDDPIVAVLEALEVKNVRFLAVVDGSGRIAGLAGQKGLMEYVADHFPGQVMVQRVGQSPALHDREGA